MQISNTSPPGAAPASPSTSDVAEQFAASGEPETIIAMATVSLDDQRERAGAVRRQSQANKRRAEAAARQDSTRAARRNLAAGLTGATLSAAAAGTGLSAGGASGEAAAEATAEVADEAARATADVASQSVGALGGVPAAATAAPTAASIGARSVAHVAPEVASHAPAYGNLLKSLAELKAIPVYTASMAETRAAADNAAAGQFGDQAEAMRSAEDRAQRLADKALGHLEAVAQARAQARLAIARG